MPSKSHSAIQQLPLGAVWFEVDCISQYDEHACNQTHTEREIYRETAYALHRFGGFTFVSAFLLVL